VIGSCGSTGLPHRKDTSVGDRRVAAPLEMLRSTGTSWFAHLPDTPGWRTNRVI